jgi:hypothetical protein
VSETETGTDKESEGRQEATRDVEPMDTVNT